MRSTLLLRATRNQTCSRLYFSCNERLRVFSSTSPAPAARVAFIGLGNMGLSMCKNLIKKTDVVSSVLAYDLDPLQVKKAEEAGAKPLSSLDELADNGPDLDFVVTSLPKCEVSKSVITKARDSLLSTSAIFPKDHEITFMDTSTISPLVSKEIALAVSSDADEATGACKISMVDAPVSGGVMGAFHGTLTFMVGGPKETCDRGTPILKCMGKNIFHCGDYGKGCVAKICNNLALSAQMIGVCEAMNLGTELGMDPKLLADVMTVSTAKSWSSEGCNPHPVAAEINNGPACRQYEGGFGASLMLKDVTLANEVATAKKVSLPVGALGQSLYQIVEHAGYGDKDFGIMLQLLSGSIGNGKWPPKEETT